MEQKSLLSPEGGQAGLSLLRSMLQGHPSPMSIPASQREGGWEIIAERLGSQQGDFSPLACRTYTAPPFAMESTPSGFRRCVEQAPVGNSMLSHSSFPQVNMCTIFV